MYIAPGGFTRGIYDQYIPLAQQAMSLAQGFSFFGDRKKPLPAYARGFDPMLLPRGSSLTGGTTEATMITGRDDGQGVLFDGRAPVLCTPYYVPYIHALTQLHPPGQGGIISLSKLLVMPLESAATDDETPDDGASVVP